jgi:hypothetical protein
VSAEEVQRLQINVIATTATVSSPTKRITIVPMLWDDVCRNGIEFMLSGRTFCIAGVSPKGACRHMTTSVPGRDRVYKVQI